MKHEETANSLGRPWASPLLRDPVTAAITIPSEEDSAGTPSDVGGPEVVHLRQIEAPSPFPNLWGLQQTDSDHPETLLPTAADSPVALATRCCRLCLTAADQMEGAARTRREMHVEITHLRLQCVKFRNRIEALEAELAALTCLPPSLLGIGPSRPPSTEPFAFDPLSYAPRVSSLEANSTPMQVRATNEIDDHGIGNAIRQNESWLRPPYKAIDSHSSGPAQILR